MKALTNKTLSYRTVGLDFFLEPQSQHWFYCFGYEWVIYRSNRGYKKFREAVIEAREHVDRILTTNN